MGYKIIKRNVAGQAKKDKMKSVKINFPKAYFMLSFCFVTLSEISILLCHAERREESVYIHFVFTDPSLRLG